MNFLKVFTSFVKTLYIRPTLNNTLLDLWETCSSQLALIHGVF